MGSAMVKSECQIVMVGLDSSGKSTVLYRLKFDQYTNTEPTIGFNCEKFKVRSGRAQGATFVIWDIGGQDKTRALWRSYLRSAEGILYVIDSLDVERMEEARIELIRLLKAPDCGGLPVLILANKQDLPRAYTSAEVEHILTAGNEFPPDQLYKVQPSCAVTGEGLDDAMNSMYDLIMKKRKSTKSDRFSKLRR